MAIRVLVKKLEGKRGVSLLIRGDGRTGNYSASFNNQGEFRINKNVVVNGKSESTNLAKNASPRAFPDFFEFTFRAEGDLLTVEANGEEVLRVRDSTLTNAGHLRFYTWRGVGVVKKAEVMTLD